MVCQYNIVNVTCYDIVRALDATLYLVSLYVISGNFCRGYMMLVSLSTILDTYDVMLFCVKEQSTVLYLY